MKRSRVSIPLEQGNVFRLDCVRISVKAKVSIPLEQGNVFRLFGYAEKKQKMKVSIPLEQGNVFRHSQHNTLDVKCASQSLWNRAMSFDVKMAHKGEELEWSQSLWNRAMSFDIIGNS